MATVADIYDSGVLEDLGLLPKYGWKARFDHEAEVKCKPFQLPRLSQIVPFVPMSFRYIFKYYLRKRYIEHRLPFIDPTQHVPWRPIYGVPMGGIGCGAIGRGFRGQFLRSSLIPGMYSYDEQPTDTFILTVRKEGKVVFHKALSPKTKLSASTNGLRSWSWGFPEKHAHYIGLYPRAWTIYELPTLHLVLICQQISPVIPNNYKTSSLPSCVFVWKVMNFGATPLEVTVSFSWNGPNPPPRDFISPLTLSNDRSHAAAPATVHTSPQSGPENSPVTPNEANGDESTKNALTRSAPFTSTNANISGCLLDRVIGSELQCCFGIAARSTDSVSVRRCPGFLYHIDTPGQIFKTKSRMSSTSTSVQEMSVKYQAFNLAPSAREVWNELQSDHGLFDLPDVGYYVPSSIRFKCQAPRLVILVSATTVVPPAHTNPVNPTRASVGVENREARHQGEGVLEPGQAQMEFAVVWHSPAVRFRGNDLQYTRRYARWFPEPGMHGAKRLLEHALTKWPSWVERIEAWQNPILRDDALPDWYKSAIFNELYYLTDGGSIWLDPIRPTPQSGVDNPTELIPIDIVRSNKSKSRLDRNNLTGRNLSDMASGDTQEDVWKRTAWQARARMGNEMGLFAYLEGHEYRMFNTFDVHMYASWALIKLWPKIQLAMNYDCADLTIEEDKTETYFIHQGCYGFRSVDLHVPHDVGDPENEPWRDSNAYIMFPTHNWKDLNSKFIIQTWRDWKVTRDEQYMAYMLPIVVRIIQTCLELWDSDGDGMIENSGFPDQTFDTWKARGISAYTGGLWLACLYGAHDMLLHALSSSSSLASALTQSNDGQGTPWTQVLGTLESTLTKAKEAYDQTLWTGSYYAYQSSRSGINQSVMAAQLCGHWFLRVTGAPADAILPTENVKKALRTIQKCNWHSIKDGAVGAINGALPNCKPDLSNVQSEEFWVGVNYSLSATMIMEGMPEDGLNLAGAVYNAVYNRFGLQYQTPEAYMSDGRFRCPGYMRPLAIWSIQHALEKTRIHSAPTATMESSDIDDEGSFREIR